MVHNLSEIILAIDFGTSHSLAGAIHNGKIIPSIKLEPTQIDSSLMRSLIYFPHSNTCFYVNEAIDKYFHSIVSGLIESARHWNEFGY